MLTIVCGRAGSGKTARVLTRLREGAERGVEDRILLVPEQFSHEAERALARELGAGASLHAEVLSFTRLASRVAAECGGAADVVPDKASKLLMMSLAVFRVSSRLTICGGRSARTGYLENILKAVEELDAAEVTEDAMLAAADAAGGAIAEKLHDLALIREAYSLVRSELLPDPRELLDRLADRLPESAVGKGGVFADGFTDFTRKELRVLECFLRRGTDVTVTLTTDGSDAEEFSVCERTKNDLADMAARRGVPCEVLRLRGTPDKPPELLYLDGALTDYSVPPYEGEHGAVEIYSLGSPEDEAMLAASRILEMMRADTTLRRRDFTVAVRGFESCAPVCESVMRDFGIAAYSGRRTDILQKPLMRLVTSALDTITGGWRSEDVFAFLKTGLTGAAADDIDILENYCLMWSVRGLSMWTRPKPWSMDPGGRSSVSDEASEQKLERINAVRADAVRPLAELDAALKKAATVAEKTHAVWDMLDGMGLAERLTARAAKLREAGDAQSADETAQLWGILTDSFERLFAVLGPLETDTEDFSRHVRLLLSQYEVGTIPASLDAVTLCDLDAVRGRPKRCLIVLGATADAIPASGGTTGIFSGDEREKLAGLGIDIGGTGDESVARELFTVYSALTSATEKLIITWPEGSDGASHPSFIVTRAAELLGVPPKTADREACMTYAVSPCVRLAVCGRTPLAAAAEKSLEGENAERLTSLRERLDVRRGSLAPDSVSALYGREFNISATRAEGFSRCRFSYFMKYGLRAEPRKKADFDQADLGTFIHAIMEKTTREIKSLGGVGAVDDARCAEIVEKHIREYAEELLAGRESSSRFVYLLGKMKESARKLALEILEELRGSDFEPLDFELDFSAGGDLPPALVRSGDMRIHVGGKVDRVDGWTSGDTLYLRVADYKSGKKQFSLSDVWYGLGMQMLIYLYMLSEEGAERYGKKVEPAGVLYLPTRDAIFSLPRSSSDGDIEAERRKALKRTGIVLDEPEVLAAMQNGEQMWLDFKGGRGKAPVALASAESLGELFRYVREYLAAIADELRNGAVDANPCGSGDTDACRFCDFAAACAFDRTRDRPRRLKTVSDAEVWERIGKGEVYRG